MAGTARIAAAIRTQRFRQIATTRILIGAVFGFLLGATFGRALASLTFPIPVVSALQANQEPARLVQWSG
jgi:hypothetical protein